MIRPLIAAILLLTPVAATAAEKEGAKALKPTASGFDVVPVATPIVVDGQVRNYVFVTIHLNPTAKADNSLMRAKEPFFRDAFVRAAHRTPFTRSDDYNSIDEARASAAVMAFAPSIVGPGQVKSVTISKQTPRNLLRAPPRPAKPPTP